MSPWFRFVPLALLLLFAGVAGARAEEAPTIAPFKTAHVRIEGMISAQGQVLPIQGDGTIDASKGASSLTIAVLGATFETIVVDGRTYSRSVLSGRWEYSEGAQANGFNPARLAPYDPATIRAAGRNFARVGPETIDGVATTHWRADADLGILLGGGPGLAGLATAPATMDLWIGDADQYLRRLSVETTAGTAGPAASAAPATPAAPARQALTLNFDTFDADVAIVAPPGAVPATPGAALGGGILASPAAAAPGSAGGAPATRVAIASANAAAEPSPRPNANNPSSVLLVRVLGVVSLVAVAIAGLIALRHRRATPPQG